ncbi:hypothetical protein CSOJ01_06697 [Colletotrichum sojae]|uniref:Uncharacterized protein n=1 Tax=Colletotrichum sojae TaxID=2175907 RepID=A0A8H6MUT0_9PEZI|nr:hypothetical protein CSOJ01_06697 [Colletotrichum sojae]
MTATLFDYVLYAFRLRHLQTLFVLQPAGIRDRHNYGSRGPPHSGPVALPNSKVSRVNDAAPSLRVKTKSPPCARFKPRSIDRRRGIRIGSDYLAEHEYAPYKSLILRVMAGSALTLGRGCDRSVEPCETAAPRTNTQVRFCVDAGPAGNPGGRSPASASKQLDRLAHPAAADISSEQHTSASLLSWVPIGRENWTPGSGEVASPGLSSSISPKQLRRSRTYSPHSPAAVHRRRLRGPAVLSLSLFYSHSPVFADCGSRERKLVHLSNLS